ncbi:TetR/AcrR family transcriptional regulator [Chromobacterium amazonense]|uniref:TetR/AcrR family transcriptional regulator n=1 Tax=Chromobacterium amazonense TaxID=1382803 RepID=A0ABU8UZ03_9NEIS|nr:TetR/AcrR family transcriptional regulator [Chromobacterium amazonense]MDQ4539851.1 TetR/AcrR family transcriptional regulator [Chromobacterium amazonense]
MSSKREAILRTALSLFATHGYHSVGVDRIKDEAGVSKMTLYKYFPTKEVLIEGVLRWRDEHFRESLEGAVAVASGCRGKIRAVFDWHDEWFRRDEFHGCMFIKASEEFPENNSPIRLVARQHKERIRQLLRLLLVEGGCKEAEPLSWYLLVMLEGVIVNANMFSDRACVDASWPYVDELLIRHLS